MLKEFLEKNYTGEEDFQAFKKCFPDMYAFSESVEVVEWSGEYAVADRNPEVIDQIEFYQMLHENGLISHEELKERLSSVREYASRTEGIAFINERKVSFRSKKPKLFIALHELGHCYFEEPDSVWSASFGGGEQVMWLIIKGLVQGNEETIRKWHTYMKMAYTDKEKLLDLLDAKALEVGMKYNIDVVKHAKEIASMLRDERYNRPVYGFLSYAGVLPSIELMPTGFLVELVEGVRYRDSFMTVFFMEFLD